MLILDDVAWLMFRFVGLIQVLIFEILSRINPPEKLGDKIEMMGRIYGGWFIFGASDRNSIPRVIRERGILVGRIILCVFALNTIQTILQTIWAARG
jgi:hypothetical protein